MGTFEWLLPLILLGPLVWRCHRLARLNRVLTRKAEVADRRWARERARSLRASQMAALGEMAAGLALEMGAPVSEGLRAVGEMAERCRTGSLEKALCGEFAEDIGKSFHRLSGMLRVLRGFAHHAAPDPMEVRPLAEVVGDALELCRGKFRGHGVDLRVQPIPQGLVVLSRGMQLTQALLRLLDDVLASAEVGPGRWAEISWSRRGSELLLELRHGGGGKGDAYLFRPFFSAPGEAPDKTGLALALGIIRAHGGELRPAAQGETAGHILCYREAK